MTESSINDSILNIKTFYGYLEHIIDSVEANDYHEPTINKISQMIKNYYDEVNAGDDESLYEDQEPEEEYIIDAPNISALFDSNQNSDEESESDTSDEEDESDDESKASDSSVETIKSGKSSQNSKTKQMIKKDEYLLNFIDGSMDNSKIELYKNDFYGDRLGIFVGNYSGY
jgi:hypothetical protein